MKSLLIVDDLQPWPHGPGFFHFSAVVARRVTGGFLVFDEFVSAADPVYHPDREEPRGATIRTEVPL